LAEIRSTIDLMMERTKGMSLSSEERDRLHREELAKRAKGFRLKLMENRSTVDDILEAMNEDSDEDRLLLDSMLWEEIFDGLPDDKSIPRFLDLMEQLPTGKAKPTVLKEMRLFFKDAAKGRSVDRKKLLTRERKRLTAAGISGTAVVPKVSKNLKANSGFLSKIEEFKHQLLDSGPKIGS
jgi:hypothetical protein